MAAEDNGNLIEHTKGLWGWSTRHPGGTPAISEPRSSASPPAAKAASCCCWIPTAEGRRVAGAGAARQGGGKEVDQGDLDPDLGRLPRPQHRGLWDRYRKGDAPVTVHGHDAVRKRLGKRVAKDFTQIEAGIEMPGGVVPYAIGKPKRQETPFWIPSHSALLFGDAVVGAEGGARAWAHDPIDAKVTAFYAERFNPTLEPLLELGAERLLMTHGPSVMENGTRVLRKGLAAGPWYHCG